MNSRDGGFTLIESVICFAFVSAITAGLANLVVVAGGLVRDARDETRASMLATQKLEQLRAALAAGTTFPSSPPSALDEDVPNLSDRPDGYQRRWRVMSLAGDGSLRQVLQVRVIVARRASMPVPAGPGGRTPGEVLLTTIAAVR